MSTGNLPPTTRRPLFLLLTLIALGLLAIVAPGASTATRAAVFLPNGQVPTSPHSTGGSKGAVPSVADAFAHLVPCNIGVTQGTTVTLDLRINAGTNTVAGQQSYLTFTNSILQVVDPNMGCGHPVTTVQPDNSAFEVTLQNTVDNGAGLIAYASGTFGAGQVGDFRVARITFCAASSGVATINWQFSPPAPSNRNSKITDVNSQDVTNRAAYQNCQLISAGNSTSTSTPTNTPTQPCPTPPVVVTPAFTPGPGCSSNPPSGVVSAVITNHPTTTSALFTNHSNTCSYPIGLAMYRKFGPDPEDWVLYDYRLAIIPPNSSLTLTVNNPPCAYQAYAFYGSLITSFNNCNRYGERALDTSSGNDGNYCGPTTCLPTRGVPCTATVTPTITQTPTRTATPTRTGTPCDVCALYFVSTDIACNPDGTVRWMAVVRNNSNCTVNTPYNVQLQTRRGSTGQFMTVAQQHYDGTFPRGRTTIGGAFCYHFQPNDTFMRVYIALDSPVLRCNADHLSQSIRTCSTQPTCE